MELSRRRMTGLTHGPPGIEVMEERSILAPKLKVEMPSSLQKRVSKEHLEMWTRRFLAPVLSQRRSSRILGSREQR